MTGRLQELGFDHHHHRSAAETHGVETLMFRGCNLQTDSFKQRPQIFSMLGTVFANFCLGFCEGLPGTRRATECIRGLTTSWCFSLTFHPVWGIFLDHHQAGKNGVKQIHPSMVFLQNRLLAIGAYKLIGKGRTSSLVFHKFAFKDYRP